MKELKREEQAAKDERQKRLARLRQICERARMKLRDSCAARRDLARAEARAKVSAAKKSRKQLQEDYREIKRFERQAAERSKAHRRKPIEAIRESDDRVMHNIPAELQPVWEKVKAGIKGTPHKSRTEAFLEWVEENPSEVETILDEAMPTDDEFAAAYEAWAREGAA